MKNIFVLILVFHSLLLSAQVSCDSFCIKDVRIDTSVNPKLLKYTINFKGNQNDFINYPYISALTNSNLDTLGTGMLSLFGHIGGTAEVYEVSTFLDSIPTDFQLHFSFDNTVCIFNNFCNPTATPIISNKDDDLKLYFNPYSRIIFSKQEIRFKEAYIKIYDQNSRLIKKEKIFERFNNYSTEDLYPAAYIFLLETADNTSVLYFLDELERK